MVRSKETGRAKKGRKRRQRSTVLPPATMMKRKQPAHKAAKPQLDRSVMVSNKLVIRAPVEHCFGIIARQLEEPPQWDPMIIDVKPVSPARNRIETISRMTFKLGRKKLTTLAMISAYDPNREIAWVSGDEPRVRECWILVPSRDDTTVAVTLSYDAPRWLISRFLDGFMRRKQVERDVSQMLGQLKGIAESNGCGQSTGSHG